MPRLRLLSALAVAAGFAGVVSLATARDRPLPPAAGQFVVACLFSHRAPDDPIVKPGRPGASHLHDFFGNRSTRAASTEASLRRAQTTCERRADGAAYWAPTLKVDGHTVLPRNAQFYYLTGLRPRASIRPHPAGLRVVAGNARATGPQDPRQVSWGCTAGRGTGHASEVPLCPPGSRLRLHIRFPDCWNGRALDAPDHVSHMAFSRLGRCPASHPVAVPILTANVVYNFRGGAGVTLSSGGQYSGHADFFNTWDQRALAALVRRCLNAGRACGRT